MSEFRRVVKVGGREFNLSAKVGNSAQSNSYIGTTAPAAGQTEPQHIFLKVSKSVEFNATIDREVVPYAGEGAFSARLETPAFTALRQRAVPKLITKLSLRDGRRGFILESHACAVSIETIIKKFPQGINAFSAMWMFRRMVSSLMYIHSRNYAHGAVTPDNCIVIMDPPSCRAYYEGAHSGFVADWKHVKESESEFPAAPTSWSSIYSPGERISCSHDVYMLARTISKLLGKDDPHDLELHESAARLKGVLSACVLGRTARLKTAFNVWHELDAVIKAVRQETGITFVPSTLDGLDANPGL